MKTGFQGTFVISWTQTEVDGLQGPSLDVLRVGASWRWSGVAVRVDGPQDVLILNGAEEMTEMRRRAFVHLQKLSFRFYDGQKTGHLVARVTRDLEEIG